MPLARKYLQELNIRTRHHTIGQEIVTMALLWISFTVTLHLSLYVSEYGCVPSPKELSFSLTPCLSLSLQPNYQLLGPKSFPLNRLMAIFYSILEEPVTPSASIYSQVWESYTWYSMQHCAHQSKAYFKRHTIPPSTIQHQYHMKQTRD